MIYLGTSGWAYKEWRPAFYPEKLAEKNFLSHYASRLNVVEVNYTFRRTVNEATLQKWLDATPPHFRFCMKANQYITHTKRLKDATEPIRRFFDSLAPLERAGRLGAVLFQLPPNLKADHVLLEEFLAQLPRGVRAAFEYRHDSWFAGEILDVLRSHNAALCLAETDDMAAPDVATTGFSYYRLRKFDYPPTARRDVADRLLKAGDAGDVFAFFKHDDRPECAVWAEDVLNKVTARAGRKAA